MSSDDGSKKKVSSGTVSFVDRFPDELKAVVPVREPKHDEAVALMNAIQNVMRRHYLASDNLNPLDVARCADAIANMWNARQMRITEEKYNGKARIPRVGN